MIGGSGKTRWLALALVGFAALSATPARADDASEAQLHFDLGANLYSQRQYAEALEHFLASNRLVANPSVVHNIAQTYGLLERWPDAFNWYETYLSDFELDAEARERGTTAQDAVRARVAVVDVHTEPIGATLFVDRAELGSVGVSPREVAVAAGEHRILARLEGHRDAEQALTTTVGQRQEVALSLAPILGTLLVQTEPEGADVFLEGSADALGTTPLSTQVGVGAQRLTIRRDGYSEVTRAVTVADGETSAVEVTLARLATDVAVLSVTGPAGGVVRVDGDEVGAAPLTMDELGPGTHRVEIASGSLEPWSEELVFEPGGVTRIAATLEDPSALHFEDLRIVGYVLGGAVLASGVGVGIGAFTEREAFFSDANPTADQLDNVNTLNAVADALMISGVVILVATLILDLAIGGRPHSRADVVVDR